jgi:acyl-coenzyme A thioesterase 9
LSNLKRDDVRDLRLSGHVIYTGRSSMEIVIKMQAIHPESSEEQTMMIGMCSFWAIIGSLLFLTLERLGRFSMVCRDAVTHKARAVPSLRLSTPEENALFSIGSG